MTGASLTVDGHKVSIRNDITNRAYSVSHIQSAKAKRRTETQGHVSVDPGSELTIRIESTTEFQYRNAEEGLLVNIHMQSSFLGSWFIQRKYKRNKHDIKVHYPNHEVTQSSPPETFAFHDLSPGETCTIGCRTTPFRRRRDAVGCYRSRKNELVVSIERGFLLSEDPHANTDKNKNLTPNWGFPDEPCFQMDSQYFRPTSSEFGLPRLCTFKNRLSSCTLHNHLQDSSMDSVVQEEDTAAQDADARSQSASHEHVNGRASSEPTAGPAAAAQSATPASILTSAAPADHQERQHTPNESPIHSIRDEKLIVKPETAEESLPKRSTTQKIDVIDLTDDDTPDHGIPDNHTPDLRGPTACLPTEYHHIGAFQTQQNEDFPAGFSLGYVSQGTRKRPFQQDRPMYNWDDYKPPTPVNISGFGSLPHYQSEENSYDLQMATSRYRQQQAKVEEERAKVEQEKAFQHLLETRRKESKTPAH